MYRVTLLQYTVVYTSAHTGRCVPEKTTERKRRCAAALRRQSTVSSPEAAAIQPYREILTGRDQRGTAEEKAGPTLKYSTQSSVQGTVSVDT